MVFYILSLYVFPNHGKHATTHCVRASLGLRVKRPNNSLAVNNSA